MGSRQNQVRSHLDGLTHFSYEHIIFLQEFLKKKTHLGELAHVTGPAYLHMNSPLERLITEDNFAQLANH